MLGRVLATLRRHSMLSADASVAVAVSGGPDSVCLLHVLLRLAPEAGFRVSAVAHVNHQLRGEESEADERFVEQIANELVIPFHTIRRPLSDEDGNLEQAARRMRRDFFGTLVMQGVAAHVALGHTRDDQAETVLFRLLRGTGISGLAGVLPAAGDGIIRPFLEVTRADVLQYLDAHGIAFRRDSSNLDLRFARNRIRHQLLPELVHQWNPHLREHLAHLADLAYEEERWWAAEVQHLVPTLIRFVHAAVEIDCTKLAALPTAAGRRLLRYAIGRAQGDLRRTSFRQVDALLDLARSSAGAGRLSLGGIRAERSFGWMRIIAGARFPEVREPLPVRVTIPGTYRLPEGNSLIRLELCDRVLDHDACVTLGLDLCSGRLPQPLELRGWRPGDHYRPLGQSRDQKLKEMFQRARVPSWQRPFWPILSSSGNIVWAKQFGVAEEFAPGGSSGPWVRIQELGVAG